MLVPLVWVSLENKPTTVAQGSNEIKKYLKPSLLWLFMLEIRCYVICVFLTDMYVLISEE